MTDAKKKPIDWYALGQSFGRAVAALVTPNLAARIRAAADAKYGVCRRCAAPLAGHSPAQICEPCHADELLERAGGGGPPGDA